MTQASEPDDLADSNAGVHPMPAAGPGPDPADHPPHGQPAQRVLLLIMRYAAPACAALALVLVMAVDVAELKDDLHLVIPDELPRGAKHLPLRALHYAGLLDVEGPTLVPEPVVVQVATAREKRTGQIVPASRALLGLEADFTLPSLRAGEWIEVVARSVSERPALTVRAHVQVRDQLQRVLPHGRALRGLQQFAPGPVQPEPGAVPPAALAVRVRGGACVPEQRCRLAVLVGEPRASVRVQENSTLTPAAGSQRISPQTSGVVLFDVTTHGPEAELWLIAERAGKRVARRAVRLAIAMGSLSVESSPRVVERSAELRVNSPTAADGCIVDAFQAGHWRHTGSLARCAERGALPFQLGTGLWRLQLRRDVFSGDTAGVASVYVREPNVSDVQVAAAWARAAEQIEPDDPFVRSCVVQPERCVDAASLEYLAAVTETGLLALPAPVTAYAARVELARGQKTRMRWLALAALGLGAAGLVLSVGRSGVSAGVRASQLFADDPGAARRARRRALLLSGASVLSLLLVFIVLALYVLARGGY